MRGGRDNVEEDCETRKRYPCGEGATVGNHRVIVLMSQANAPGRLRLFSGETSQPLSQKAVLSLLGDSLHILQNI